jgi:hypothetical protein
MKVAIEGVSVGIQKKVMMLAEKLRTKKTLH